MEEEKISILESAIYPVSLYVNDFGYDDIGEALNIEDPVSCLLAYKQDNLLIKIIDKEDIKAVVVGERAGRNFYLYLAAHADSDIYSAIEV